MTWRSRLCSTCALPLGLKLFEVYNPLVSMCFSSHCYCCWSIYHSKYQFLFHFLSFSCLLLQLPLLYSWDFAISIRHFLALYFTVLILLESICSSIFYSLINWDLSLSSISALLGELCWIPASPWSLILLFLVLDEFLHAIQCCLSCLLFCPHQQLVIIVQISL